MNVLKKITSLGLIFSFVFATIAVAQSSSSNFLIEEYFIGPGGENDLNSANYNARATLGDAGVGNSASTNYQAYSGFTTTNDPHLELTVDAALIDFGVLDTNSTATGTGEFSVRSYLNSGYAVTTSGVAPTNATGDSLDPIASATASTPGVEQFGINLVSNTNPESFGAIAAQVPSASFSFGTAAGGYNTPNLFQYNEGDTIAESLTSSGQTDYTISYVLNISPNTPSGLYTMKHFVVATPTF